MEPKGKSRVAILKERIKLLTDPEEIMLEIVDVFKDLEIIPDVGMYCTFIYNAKGVRNRSKESVVPSTGKIFYDQHPLVQVLSVQRWGFRAFNYHWVGRGEEIHNYTWDEVAGQLHIIKPNEMSFMKTVDYVKLQRYQTI